MENYDTEMQMGARRCKEKARDRDYRQNCIFRTRISASKHGNCFRRGAGLGEKEKKGSSRSKEFINVDLRRNQYEDLEINCTKPTVMNA